MNFLVVNIAEYLNDFQDLINLSHVDAISGLVVSRYRTRICNKIIKNIYEIDYGNNYVYSKYTDSCSALKTIHEKKKKMLIKGYDLTQLSTKNYLKIFEELNDINHNYYTALLLGKIYLVKVLFTGVKKKETYLKKTAQRIGGICQMDSIHYFTAKHPEYMIHIIEAGFFNSRILDYFIEKHPDVLNTFSMKITLSLQTERYNSKDYMETLTIVMQNRSIHNYFTYILSVDKYALTDATLYFCMNISYHSENWLLFYFLSEYVRDVKWKILG